MYIIIKEIKKLIPRALFNSFKKTWEVPLAHASLHFSRVLKNSRILI